MRSVRRQEWKTTVRRLFVVYNPKSARAAAIEAEVLAPLRGLTGWMVGKFEVKAPSVDENAPELAKLLKDGDLVIVAGGDGTAAVAANGVMLAGKEATLGVLGYGNLNDMAGMLGEKEVLEIVRKFEAKETREIYPLEVRLDEKHWRYAPCYATIGLLAEATELMDDKKVRASLRKGRRGPVFSLGRAVKWYLKNKRRQFLPKGMKLNGVEVPPKTTDYLAVNGPTLARMMKGGDWYQRAEGFGSGVRRLGGFWQMVGFGLKSVFAKVPLDETKRDVIEFAEASEVEIQAEGEYQKVKVQKIEVRKGKALKVVSGKF